MNKVLEIIEKIGIVPVVVLDDAKSAVPLAKALIDGGIPCAEVTFRTEAAEESIKAMTAAYPDMLVGAGTVLTCDQADRAVAAGARFIVSPGFNPRIVQHCIDKGVPITPGCSCPSDIERALEMGLDVVKFFPAEACGGIAAIKAMAAPYTTVKFMPTGGVNAKNLNNYLAFPKILACGGSWMAAKDLVAAGEFGQIEALTREAVLNMLGFELHHVGVNCADEGEASKVADTFDDMFGLTKKIGNTSIFAGGAVEAMKSPYLGTSGHLAIGTNHIDRAVYYLESRGYMTEPETAKYKNGKMTAIYLKGEVGGFAIHLVQK